MSLPSKIHSFDYSTSSIAEHSNNNYETSTISSKSTSAASIISSVSSSSAHSRNTVRPLNLRSAQRYPIRTPLLSPTSEPPTPEHAQYSYFPTTTDDYNDRYREEGYRQHLNSRKQPLNLKINSTAPSASVKLYNEPQYFTHTSFTNNQTLAANDHSLKPTSSFATFSTNSSNISKATSNSYTGNSRYNNIPLPFPPTNEMIAKSKDTLLTTQQSFRVLYAGDASYKHSCPNSNKTSITGSSNNSKSKRGYFIVTNNQILLYKSAQKARQELNIFEHSHQPHQQDAVLSASEVKPTISSGSVLLQLSCIYAVHHVSTLRCTFRIDYLSFSSVSKGSNLATTTTATVPRDVLEQQHASSYILTVSTDIEAKQWVQALRKAIKIHHPCMMDRQLGPLDRRQVLNRMAKQGEDITFDLKNDKQVRMYRVVFKEKRQTSKQQDQIKEVFLPVTLAIGKFSFYLLPFYLANNNNNNNGNDKASAFYEQQYLDTVERDRFGFLSIHSTRFQEVEDDTIVMEVKQVNEKCNRQLVFASTFCEDIILFMTRAMVSFDPNSIKHLFPRSMPRSIADAQIQPFKITYDNSIITDETSEILPTAHLLDEQGHMFLTTLQAYAASMNLNMARICLSITGSMNAKVLVLLPPNEIHGTAEHYDKYELLAILKSIQAHDIFVEVRLAHQDLSDLEIWKIQSQYGWTHTDNHHIQSSNFLLNQLYTILTTSSHLEKLDITNCSIGKQVYKELREQPQGHQRPILTAISSIGHAMKSEFTTSLSCLYAGKNYLSKLDVQNLIHGIKYYNSSIRALHLNDMVEIENDGLKTHKLNTDTLETILLVLYEKNPEKLQSLDISIKPSSLSTKPAASNNADSRIIERVLPAFRQLKCLSARGHTLLKYPTFQTYLKTTYQLTELDLSESQMNPTDLVGHICAWMSIEQQQSTNVESSFRMLRKLGLRRCYLNGKHVYDLLVHITLSGNRTELHVDLSRNIPILKEVMYLPKFYSAILHGEGPSSLSLAGLEWDEATLREFFDCMRDNPTIVHLDLSDIYILKTTNSTGCYAFEDYEEMTRQGNTSKCSLSEDTIRMLMSLFERNTVIKELKLGYNSSHEEETLDVNGLNASESHQKFQKAFIKKSIVGDAIAQSLVGLCHNTTLQSLDLSGLLFGDTGAFSLSRLLKANRSLKTINLDKNHITIEGYRNLTKTIKETATQIEAIPFPRHDLRYQRNYLKLRIEELLLIENEAQFFLVHTTASDKKRAKKQEQAFIVRERATCAESLRDIEAVIQDLMLAVKQNRQDIDRHATLQQIQSEQVTNELIRAQIQLQQQQGRRRFILTPEGSDSVMYKSSHQQLQGLKNDTSNDIPHSYEPLFNGPRYTNIDDGDNKPNTYEQHLTHNMSPGRSAEGYNGQQSESNLAYSKPHSYDADHFWEGSTTLSLQLAPSSSAVTCASTIQHSMSNLKIQEFLNGEDITDNLTYVADYEEDEFIDPHYYNYLKNHAPVSPHPRKASCNGKQ